MVWLPGARPEVVNVALPPLSMGAVPRVVEPSWKVTLPVGVPLAGDVTVAVRVTGVPDAEGFDDDVRDVVVELLAVVHVAGGRVMRLLSNVTAPVWASARPGRMLARVFMEMLVLTNIVPTNAVSVPSVAELPICQ
jgi:hypothetical protein